MNASEEKVIRKKPIPDKKISLVEELTEKIKMSRTVMIASCKGLPGQQFHQIKKQLRGKAELKVARKSSIIRAIDNIDKGAVKNLKQELKADIVLFFSKMDPFELSGLLSDSQSPTKARAGDIAPEDIEIEPGPTELVPGPAISELGAVGLKVAVKDGKLEIKKGAVVARENEPITEAVAGVLAKLGIAPMKVGFVPLVAYDSEEDKVYVGIKIDKEAALQELKDLIGKALGLAVSRGYPSKETILFFISRAGSEEKALEKLVGKEESVEEEKKGGGEDTKEEEKQEVVESEKEDLNTKEKQDIKESE